MEIAYERLESVVLKIVRGLYFYEYDVPLPIEASVNCKWLNAKWLQDEARPFVEGLPLGRSQWPGIFQYKCSRVPESPYASIWLFLFFEYAAWWAITTPEPD